MVSDSDELSEEAQEALKAIARALGRQAAQEYFESYQSTGKPPEDWMLDDEIQEKEAD